MDRVFNLDDCMAVITCRSAKVFAEALERRFRQYNVTRAQWIAMYNLRSGGITQRELADRMSIKEPTAVRLLQKLEQDGLVARSGRDGDRRVKQLFLTEKGERVYAEMVPVAEKFKNDTIVGISQEDLETLKDTLDRMVENARRQE